MFSKMISILMATILMNMICSASQAQNAGDRNAPHESKTRARYEDPRRIREEALSRPRTRQAEYDRDFRKGRPKTRGNENSNRVTQVQVGEVRYAGSGCPQSTMTAVFAPDNLSFSLLFDQFVAQVEGNNQRPNDTISCDIRIPIQIPAGQQMEITRVDYRGYAGLPSRSQGLLSSVFFFRGSTDRDRMVMKYKFNGPLNEDYEISSDVLQHRGQPVGTETSPCGGPTVLIVKNTLRVVAANVSEAAMVTIDSIDSASQSVYFVNWRSCRVR